MEVKVDLSPSLLNFLQALVEKGSFSSVEAFVDYATYVIADLYGFSESVGGKSLASALAAVVPTAPATTPSERISHVTPSPEEIAVLEAFTSKLELHEAIYMNHVMTAAQGGQRPIEKTAFDAAIETLIERGQIKRVEQADKVYLKLLE